MLTVKAGNSRRSLVIYALPQKNSRHGVGVHSGHPRPVQVELWAPLCF